MKWLITCSFIFMVSNQSANIVRHEKPSGNIIKLYTPLITLKTDLDTLNGSLQSLQRELETNFLKK